MQETFARPLLLRKRSAHAKQAALRGFALPNARQHGATLAETAARRTKRNTLLGLAAIAAFAFSYLQFALVQWNHAPAETRVNNGSQPTFFAFHVNPYGVTSEDFHLYVVRAKRILDRGWVSSPLSKEFETRPSYAAPLQALLGMVALQTDGRPLPYSIYMACIFFCGWGTLFLVARRFLSASVPASTIVFGVLLAVLFESVDNFFVSQFDSQGVWPAHRNMRMATLAWTTPLLLAAVIAATSIWFERSSRMLAVFVIGIILFVLCGVDNWALSLAFMSTAFVAFTLGVATVYHDLRRRTVSIDAWKVLAALALVLVAAYGMQNWFTHRIAGDALIRGGIGKAWLHDRKDPRLWSGIVAQWLWPWGAITLALAILPALLKSVRAAKPGQPRWRFQITLVPGTHWQLLAVGLLGVVAMLIVLQMVSRRGLEPYVRNQVYWRVNVLLLFSLILGWAEAFRTALTNAKWRLPRLAKAWTPLAVSTILVLFAYHQYRIHWFATNVIAKEYFLTADAEALRPWLEKYDREHKQFTLATLSPELNFLCAYWTNADLLLPSGFPYHNANSNSSIRRATVELLRLYNVSADTWKEFTRPSKIRFTDRWRESRAEAAGLAFMYLLYHREAQLDSEQFPKWRSREMNAIAKALTAAADAPPAKPDIILVDQVSRSVGQADLSDYSLQFMAGAIQVWVRNADGQPDPTTVATHSAN